MMKPMLDFASRVRAKLVLNPKLVVEREGRYFLLNKDLRSITRKDFFYAGKYLGKMKKGKFFPSFNLLAMLAEKEANKIVIDEKAAWLFICSRNILGGGIKAVHGSRRKGDFALVLNEFGECLGFGRVLRDLTSKDVNASIRNVSDIGDFLRRER